MIDTELLLKNPEGISLLGCAVVKIDPAVSEQELLEKVCLRHCALVKCSKNESMKTEGSSGINRT